MIQYVYKQFFTLEGLGVKGFDWSKRDYFYIAVGIVLIILLIVGVLINLPV